MSPPSCSHRRLLRYTHSAQDGQETTTTTSDYDVVQLCPGPDTLLVRYRNGAWAGWGTNTESQLQHMALCPSDTRTQTKPNGVPPTRLRSPGATRMHPLSASLRSAFSSSSSLTSAATLCSGVNVAPALAAVTLLPLLAAPTPSSTTATRLKSGATNTFDSRKAYSAAHACDDVGDGHHAEANAVVTAVAGRGFSLVVDGTDVYHLPSPWASGGPAVHEDDYPPVQLPPMTRAKERMLRRG